MSCLRKSILRSSSLRAGACSGLILSGALNLALKGRGLGAVERIKVTKTPSQFSTIFAFNVEAVEGSTNTVHRVEFAKAYYEQLTENKISPEELVKKSFEFLLSRESKDSILRSFNLKQIGFYFPEFETEMKKQLQEEK